MFTRSLALCAAATWLLSAAPCSAGSLQVSTVTLDVASPGAATSLTLRNHGAKPANAQIRVLKWSQKDGLEQLIPADDVVASPPFAAVEPGREATIRVVRVAREPAHIEESYRLLIDELPTSEPAAKFGVNFAVRHSIPVFFGPTARTPATLIWRAEADHGRLRLIATNPGNKRVRLSALRLAGPDAGGSFRQEGLVGYVLSGSSMSWTFPYPGRRHQLESLSIMADSDNGPINARTAVVARR